MNLPREIFDEFALGKSVLPRLKSVVRPQLIGEYNIFTVCLSTSHGISCFITDETPCFAIF